MKEYVVREYEQSDYDKAREEMTFEKANEVLGQIGRGYLPDYNYTGSEDDYDHFILHLAIRKAQEACKEMAKDEKQLEDMGNNSLDER